MPSRRIAAIACGVTALAAATWPLVAQQRAASGPVARYDMRAGTVSGAGGPGMGMGMAGMFGGGGRGDSAHHELFLRLGSALAPAGGTPKADHFMPPAVQLGVSVPLLTPRAEREPTDAMPGQMDRERPKGRMLIFWGCGEHAGKGQPVIIDFSKLAAGQVPPGLWSTTILRDWGPGIANSRTFGRWPNEDERGGARNIPLGASLIGKHRVSGNYSPEIAFALSKDFMGALKVSTGASPGGGLLLRWNGLVDATGYHASLFGATEGGRGGGGDVVMWSSSATRQFGGGLDDWLSPAQVAGLVRDQTVLPPATTSCVVPSEVRSATQFRMGRLTAFGPEEDFSYPPRPANARVAWNLLWTARIRHRSTTSWMDIPGMEDAYDEDGNGRSRPNSSSRPKCKPRGGFGGVLGGVLGGGNGC